MRGSYLVLENDVRDVLHSKVGVVQLGKKCGVF
jgi:hypothetical protein